MKVYISADMEGVAGVVNQEQLRPAGFEFQQFREFMTAEVNAAIEGAREGGATEIVVSDSHGTGLNLLMDALPQDIQLVRSWPRPLGMMEGIDDSFSAAILQRGEHRRYCRAYNLKCDFVLCENQWHRDERRRYQRIDRRAFWSPRRDDERRRSGGERSV